MATTTRIELAHDDVDRQVARTIRTARMLVGWSQQELAKRAVVSQATVSRVEAGGAASLDMMVVRRLFTALGLRAGLEIDDFRLDDRRRQRDGVHAVVNGSCARRLERQDWLIALEVLIGADVPRGWIDLLAFREADRALLVQETKTDIPDMGALQRSVAFYERAAMSVARGLGWDARTVSVLVVLLDSETMGRRLADNRLTVARVFPGPVPQMAAWLADPARPVPTGWTIGTHDPASRAATWLRPTTLGSRRSAPAYRDYADAASRLLRA